MISPGCLRWIYIWSLLWLPSRSGLAATYENVAQLVDLLHHCRAHHSTDDPNTWPSSRPGLAAHGRDYGLPSVDHQRNIGSPFYHVGLSHGLLATIGDSFSVSSLRIADGSMVTPLSFLRSLFPPLPRALRSPTVSLAVRNASIVAGSFARLSRLRSFLLLMVHPALSFFFSLAVLADATAHAIVSHQTSSFFAQEASFATFREFAS